MKTIYKQEALPKIPKRKRVAAYARVSSGKETMKHSLSAQVSYYNNLIQKRIDWAFAGVYADDAISGTKENRAEFQRMLTDCRAGAIDMVITKSVTRFARNTLTTLETVRELKALGVDVYFEKENIHSMSGDGELMLSILASFAQEESRSASENCKWRIRRMFEQGRPNTGNMLGYRLVDGRLQIVPEEAAVVRLIFSSYLDGMGGNAIAKKLAALGIQTRSGKGWEENTIFKMLRNEKYAGILLLQKTFSENHLSKKKCINQGELPMYHIKNGHEAIIDKERFACVQAEILRRAMSQRPPRKTAETYPFTGKVVCLQCGKKYRRKVVHSGAPYEKPVWICSTFNKKGKTACNSQQIPEDILTTETLKVLDLAELNTALLWQQLSEIQAAAHNRLTYIFRDGQSVNVDWQHPSRRESWTPEMKQVARERQLKMIQERNTRDEQ